MRDVLLIYEHMASLSEPSEICSFTHLLGHITENEGGSLHRVSHSACHHELFLHCLQDKTRPILCFFLVSMKKVLDHL